MNKRALSLLVASALLATSVQAADRGDRAIEREVRRQERAAEREDRRLARADARAEKALAQTNKEESIGIGAGVAIGALAGGPAGVILGGAFGGWLGDRFHQERTAREASEESHRMARAEADSLVTRLSASERRAARMETELRSTQVAHRAQLARALEIDVLFRTEESAVDEITEQRLAQLAELVAPIEGTLIHVEGHADVRGTEKYNAELSAARAAAVRDALLRGGLTPDRIIVTAVGKSRATASEQDVEGLARDRRVAVSIVTLEDLQRVALQD